MNKNTILSLYSKQKKKKNEDTKFKLNCFCNSDEKSGNVNFTFEVPLSWLISYMNEGMQTKWDVNRITFFLNYQSCYEDSMAVFETAVRQNKCYNLIFF